MSASAAAAGAAQREPWTADLVCRDWTKLRQTTPGHRPGEGLIGDCYRTAIACLIGATDPTEVPHFVEENVTGSGFDDRAAARHWLRRTLGIDMMTVSLEAAKRYGVPYLVSVNSKTGPWHHIVVGLGEDVAHDPSGVDSYTLADVPDDDPTAEVLCMMYEPDPDEMVRQWRAAEADDA